MRLYQSAAILTTTFLCAGNAFAYNQDYLTYWETSAGPGSQTWYDYVVANTGSADYSTTTSVISVGPPTVLRTTIYNEIPIITSYAVPVLSVSAWATVSQASIYQPTGWSWRVIDSTPTNWTNTSGNSLFDNPYKLLEWYVVDKAAPGDWDYRWQHDYGLGPNYTRDEVNEWASLSPDPVEFSHLEGTDTLGNTIWESSGSIWSEVTAPAFGFLAYSGKTLSPDQTGWDLAIQDYFFVTTFTPLPPRIGDPDIPLKGSGIGGVALPYTLAPVPEPETCAMMLAGLGLVGLASRRRKLKANG